MEKELEEIKNIVAIHFGALGFLNPSENEQILKDRDKVLNTINELKAIKEANPTEALECLKNNSELFDKIALENPKTYKNETFTEAYLFKANTIKIEQALINKSKKEQGFDILLSILTDNLDFNEEKEMMIYSTAKACENTFGKDSKELILIKELLNINENKYIDFCKRYSKDE